jgi:hypothetical protein
MRVVRLCIGDVAIFAAGFLDAGDRLDGGMIRDALGVSNGLAKCRRVDVRQVYA